jgi:hypothetical protein
MTDFRRASYCANVTLGWLDCANVTLGHSSRTNVTFARKPLPSWAPTNGKLGHSSRANVTLGRNDARAVR